MAVISNAQLVQQVCNAIRYRRLRSGCVCDAVLSVVHEHKRALILQLDLQSKQTITITVIGVSDLSKDGSAATADSFVIQNAELYTSLRRDIAELAAAVYCPYRPHKQQ